VSANAPTAASVAPPALRRRHLGTKTLQLLVLAGATLLLRLPGLLYPIYSADEASTATLAEGILRGGLLYHAVADRKPPLVPYLYAGVMWLTGSKDLRFERLAVDLLLLLTAWLVRSEAARRFRSDLAGLAAGLALLVASVAMLPGDGQAASFEAVMILPATAAVLAARRRWVVLAGVCVALAGLAKQTGLATALPVAWLLFDTPGPLGRRVGRVVAAGMVASAVVLAPAAVFGLGPYVKWNLTGNGGYLALDGSGAHIALASLGQLSVWLVANAGLIWLAWRSRRCRPLGRDLVLWLASGAFAVTLGFRFFEHYFIQLAPPLAIAAGGGMLTIDLCAWRKTLLRVGLVPLVMVLLAIEPEWFTGEPPIHRIAHAVSALDPNRRPIFVWGELSEIYWLTDLRPASPIILAAFLTGSSGGRSPGSGRPRDGIPGAWQMLEKAFTRHPPAVIVDTAPEHLRGFGRYPLLATRIGPWVEDHYRVATQVAGAMLFVPRRHPYPPWWETSGPAGEPGSKTSSPAIIAASVTAIRRASAVVSSSVP
jgi:hypothetical protein